MRVHPLPIYGRRLCPVCSAVQKPYIDPVTEQPVPMTAHEFNCFTVSGKCPPELKAEFDSTTAYVKRSEAAKRGAKTRKLRRSAG